MPTVETNGIQTYYESYGSGPEVVFLHGAGSDHRLWAEQIRPLADDYRIIVYDLRGHGLTGGSSVVSYTLQLYSEDLNSFLTALDLDEPAVCGISLGGMIALKYVSEHPDTVSALVTLGTELPERLTYGEWIEGQVPRLIDTLSRVVDREKLLRIKRRIDDWRYDERGKASIEEIECIQQNHGEKIPEPSDSESKKIREMMDSYQSTDIEYAAITVPSLHLCGEYEIEWIKRHTNRLAEVLPNADARQVPNAGHTSHVDNPEYIIRSLEELLGQCHS